VKLKWQTGTSCLCACPNSGVLWSVVYGSSFDLLINSHILISCDVHHEYNVLFRQGNSELTSWCGFPLCWRPWVTYGWFIRYSFLEKILSVAITSLLISDYNSSWARQITKKPAKSLIICMMKEEENRKTERANQWTISEDKIQTRETQK
jgi:hypothetical protein